MKSSFLFHRAPSWTVDDRALLTANGDLRFSELFRIALDTQQVQQLSNNQARRALESIAQGLFYYSSKRDGLWQRVDGSEENDRFIECSQNMIGAYAWTLESDALYFVVAERNEDVVMRFDLNTQQCQSLLYLPANTVASNSSISFDALSQTLMMTFSERLPTEIYSVKW